MENQKNIIKKHTEKKPKSKDRLMEVDPYELSEEADYRFRRTLKEQGIKPIIIGDKSK